MEDHEYLEQVKQALLSFQMLEEALKIHIGLYVEVEKKSGASSEKFDKLMHGLSETPLRYLIKRFKKTNFNEAVISQLESEDLQNWRNFLAHNAYQHEFLNRTSASTFSRHTPVDVAKVGIHVGNLVLDIGEEIKKLQKRYADSVAK